MSYELRSGSAPSRLTLPVIVLVLLALVIGINLYNQRANIFRLRPTATCEQYKEASVERAVAFQMGCECMMTDEQIDMNEMFGDYVLDCFRDRIRKCRGPEQIGQLLRSCSQRLVERKS